MKTGASSFVTLLLEHIPVQVENDRFEAASVQVQIRERESASPVTISLKLKQVNEQVTVSARSESLTLPSAQIAQERLETFPGNVSEIPADAYRGGAITSMDDALSQTPGVFAQPKGGTEEVRLSVRGSGMNVPFGSRGVQILRNGIPLSRADGFSNPDLPPGLSTFTRIFLPFSSLSRVRANEQLGSESAWEGAVFEIPVSTNTDSSGEVGHALISVASSTAK